MHESNFAIEIENIYRFHTGTERKLSFIQHMYICCAYSKPKFQGQSDKWGWGGVNETLERERLTIAVAL